MFHASQAQAKLDLYKRKLEDHFKAEGEEGQIRTGKRRARERNAEPSIHFPPEWKNVILDEESEQDLESEDGSSSSLWGTKKEQRGNPCY